MTGPLKCDAQAADRALTAVVRKARAQIAGCEATKTAEYGDHTWTWRDYDREAIVDMFTAAVVTADVLLEGRPA